VQSACTRVELSAEIVRRIHNDGFRSAADNNPLEGDILRRVHLPVRKPRRDINEIPCVKRYVAFPSLAPPNVRRAGEDIGYRVLLSMVMDSRTGSRFDEEQTSPNRRFYAGSRMDGGKAL
jgi:hypothetical protein